MRWQLALTNGQTSVGEPWLGTSAVAGRASRTGRRSSSLARLLAGISASAAALMLSLVPNPVAAQAVVGTPTPQFGISSVIREGTTDTVNVRSFEALLDWNATSTTGVFLPEGNTLRFDGGGEQYTVLNRVTSSQFGGPLSIAGRVESESSGSVWFYNPSGWVVGASGVFDVGSLVLTSLPIAVDPATDTVSRLFGDNNEIRFGTAPNPASAVTINSGAQINALSASNSYIAVVAPRVTQGGTVQVNGSAAYVGAEAATITINSGLFDIVVGSGTGDAAGVAHTGTTTGPPANQSDPNHRIYVVAVPKNQAMTAVVSGSLGYAAATNASFETDGSIVLSAGYNVTQGTVTPGAASSNASLSISDLAASNDVAGFASGAISVSANAANVTLAKNATLWSQGNVSVNIGAARALTVGGYLDIRSQSATAAGDIAIALASGSALSVTGDLSAISSSIGLIKLDPDNGDVLAANSLGESARAGNVGITVRDANFAVGGQMTLASEATGGVGALSAGAAQAGNVSFTALQDNPVSPARTISLGNVQLTSNASTGSFNAPQVPVTGSQSASGDVSFRANGGLLTAGRIGLDSDSQASPGSDLAAQPASAGRIEVSFANSADTFRATSLELGNSASAAGSGAAALGGVSLSLDAADVSIGDSYFGYVYLSSSANGTLTTPNAIALSLTNGASLDLTEGSLSVDAYASDALDAQASSNIAITLDNSALSLGSFNARTSAFARNSGAQGVAGDIALAIRNGGALAALYSVQISSYGYGGNGFDAGDGVGGNVSFDLDDSTFAASNFDQRSIGTAGFQDDPAGGFGTGRGGAISFHQGGSTASFVVSSFDMQVTGMGRNNEGDRFSLLAAGPSGGAGADGIGGTAAFTLDDGTFSVDTLRIVANGEGGNGINFDGEAPGRGGNGTGGAATLLVRGGTVSADTLEVSASGFGGDGARVDGLFVGQAGHGGNGTGGAASVSLTGGTLTTDSVTISANGNKSDDFGYGSTHYYGSGGSVYYSDGTGGTGGIGQGGNALLTIDGGALEKASDTSSVVFAVAVNALGEGGAGGETYSDTTPSDYLANSGSGGAGIGGTAGIRYFSGTFDAAAITIDASGLGSPAGNDANQNGQLAVGAGAGGSGTGGAARFDIGTDFSGLTSADDQRLVTVRAVGEASSGEDGQTGGAGGNGVGGSVVVNVTGGLVTLETPVLSAFGSAGDGGSSNDDRDGGAGGNATGGTIAIGAAGDGAQLTLLGSGMAFAAWGRGGDGGSGGDGSLSVNGAGNGGTGGRGTGGTVSFTAANLGSFDVTPLIDVENVDVQGRGGDGGSGGNASFYGSTATGNGGAGGAGIGGGIAGRAQSGGTLSFGIAEFDTSGAGGDGGGLNSVSPGANLQASIGGAGGAGSGGSLSLTATGAGSALGIRSLSAFANGFGGSGESGVGNDPLTGNGAAGGDGGAATGGNISILATDNGRLVVAEFGGISELVADAFGGDGGLGVRGQFASNGNGANGGAGGANGSGLGGTIAIAASIQGTVDLALTGTTTMQANGTSGLAGIGGDGGNVNTSDPAAFGGNGGNSGMSNRGRGGVISLLAEGGSLATGALTIDALGLTNFGQTLASGGLGPNGNGPNGNGTGGPGMFGTAGSEDAAGGRISFASFDDPDGNIGNLIAGDTDAEVTSGTNFVGANGTFFGSNPAGSITLTNDSHQAVNSMRFASFIGNATGSGGVETGIVIDAILGPITIDGALTLAASSAIVLNMNGLALETNGGAEISVGTTASLRSDSGIVIDGTNTGQFSAETIDLSTFGSINIIGVGCVSLACAPVHATGQLTAEANGDFNLFGQTNVTGLGGVEVYAGDTITGENGTGYFSNGNVQVRGGNDVTVRNARGNNVTVAAGAVVDGSTFYYPATLTLGEVEGGGVIRAAGNGSFASGGGIMVTDGNTIAAAAAIDFASGNDIIVGANNVITGNAALPNNPVPLRFRAGGLAVNYTLDPADIATLSIGSGTVVNSNNGNIVLSGAAIDARLASFLGNGLSVDVTRLLAIGDARRDDDGRLDDDCLEGAICIGDVDSAGNVAIGQGSIRPRDVLVAGRIAGSTVRISALGDIRVGAPEATASVVARGTATLASQQGDVAVLSGAVIQGNSVALSGAGSLTGSAIIEAVAGDVGLSFGGDIDAGAIVAARQLTTATATGGGLEASFSTPGSLRVGTLNIGAANSGGQTQISAGADIAIGNLDLAGNNGVLNASGNLTLDRVSGVSNLTLSGASIGFDLIEVSGNLALNGTTINGVSAFAGGTLDIVSDDLTAGLLQSVGNLTVTVVNTAALGAVASTGGSVAIDPVLLTFDSITAAGAIDLAGGTIIGGTVDAGTTLGVAATVALTLDDATAGGAIAVAAPQATIASITGGGALGVTVANAAVIGAMQANGAINLTAGSLTLGSSQSGLGSRLAIAGRAQLGAVNAAGDITINADALTFSTIRAGGNFASTTRTLTGDAIDAVRDIRINTQTDLTLAALSGAGIEISSNGAVNLPSLAASGEVTISASSVNLTSPGALQIGSVSASGGNIALRSTAANLAIRRLLATGDIVLDAARDIQIDTSADAGNAFTANAAGIVRLNGLATGRTIAISSSDMAIAANGQLGKTSQTDAITLNNSGQSATLLGDNLAAQSSGFALSQAEFARIQSRGNLTIGGGTFMQVGDLAVTAQAGTTLGQIGETGRLTLNSRGLMSFLGALSVSNAGGNTLAINGREDIFLDATGGSIRLSDGQTRAGTLRISGSGIALVTRAALDEITGLTDTALITARLSLNDGVTADRTLIEADAISLQSDRDVTIQNTSASVGFADRRGLVANSLEIGSRDGGTLDIVINGIVNGATGIDAIDVISFDEDFTALSSVNGCVINNASACGVVAPVEQPVFEPVAVRDVIVEVLGEDIEDTALQVTDSFSRTTLIQLNQLAPAGFEPLIDEPVTGTGNDDLLRDDDDDDDGDE